MEALGRHGEIETRNKSERERWGERGRGEKGRRGEEVQILPV
jgi:hypothetical protein